MQLSSHNVGAAMGNKTGLYNTHITFPVRRGRDKMKELIVYISAASENDVTFGAVKLNKVLFHSDFRSFERFGTPITGQQYQRLRNGPAPKALLHIRRDLVNDGSIHVKQVPFRGKTQERTIALRNPDLSFIDDREIALVDEVIKELWGKTASTVSLESHGIQWETHRDNEPIPYEAAYLSDEPVSEKDIAITKSLMEENRWSFA